MWEQVKASREGMTSTVDEFHRKLMLLRSAAHGDFQVTPSSSQRCKGYEGGCVGSVVWWNVWCCCWGEGALAASPGSRAPERAVPRS
eukprot:218465-Rhodomonas_salina.1